MMLFIGAGCGLVVGGILGWFMRERYARYVLRHIVQEAVAERQRAEEDTLVSVMVHRRGDMFYMYNASTEEFLAQGRTHEEVTDNLKARFPDIKFMANPKNLTEVGYPWTYTYPEDQDDDAV